MPSRKHHDQWWNFLLGACSSSNMFETITSSSQYGVNLKSSSALSTAGSYFRIQDASGTDLGTFITPRGAYYFHFSSPSMKASSTYFNLYGRKLFRRNHLWKHKHGGYSTNGTYSGGTQKKTFTTLFSVISTLTL